MTDTSKDAVARLCLAMINSGNTTTANMLNALADERDRLATAHTQLQVSLSAANARADQARDAALVEAAGVANKAMRKFALAAYQNDEGRMQNAASTYCADEIRVEILALRDKPAPAVTVGIDALAYRFWSIHPKDIPNPVGMPEGYKGGARAWMYATEIRELISAIAGGGNE